MSTSSYDYNTVTVYPAGSIGNVAPSAAIGGFKTGLFGPKGIALDVGTSTSRTTTTAR